MLLEPENIKILCPLLGDQLKLANQLRLRRVAAQNKEVNYFSYFETDIVI